MAQIQQIKKMGNVKDLIGMIPGMGKAVKNMDIDENAFKSIEAIIQSMTPEEREDPSIMNGSRRNRIAKGSGTSVPEVNKLLKQFSETCRLMKSVSGGGPRGALGNMGRMMRR